MKIVNVSTLTQLTARQRAWVELKFQERRKSGGTAFVLCLLFGGIGVHHFYLGHTILGVLSIVFCWTWVPLILSLIQCLFIVFQVSSKNETILAALISESVLLLPENAPIIPSPVTPDALPIS
jgi:TM2 domain-containing membrane protein YozV